MNIQKNTQKSWEYIQQSPFAEIYLQEVYWLAKDIELVSEKLFGVTAGAQSEGHEMIQVNHEVISNIFHILTQSARIRTFFNRRNRNSFKSDTKYQLHLVRISWLENKLDGVQMEEIKKSKVRNTIEHSDEYFDETALKSLKALIKRPSLIPIDMTVSNDNLFDQFLPSQGGEVYPLRIYNSTTKDFTNCGHTINIGRLHDEAAQIAIRLLSFLDKNIADPNRGSSVVVITDTSFNI